MGGGLNVERYQMGFQDVNDAYALFVDKFKPKKTTDDCYTPEPIYDAVASYVSETYGIDAIHFVRPFWPNADYRRYDYNAESVVVDNPPFSILSGIIAFYLKEGIRFFLFAPTLTVLSAAQDRCCSIVTGSTITYENGAKVNTSFITNLETNIARSCPELRARIENADKTDAKKALPKYAYPNEIITASKMTNFTKNGISFVIKKGEAKFISALDAQKPHKKMYGAGLIVSSDVAAQAAQAAQAEKIVWELSERERVIVNSLGKEEYNAE